MEQTRFKRILSKRNKDELSYYSTQFNSIELNATFYNLYPKEQFVKWAQKTSNYFKFYPTITQDISCYHQLNLESYHITETFLNSVYSFCSSQSPIRLQTLR